ncbi:Protein RALF-like 34 [Linum perenne]
MAPSVHFVFLVTIFISMSLGNANQVIMIDALQWQSSASVASTSQVSFYDVGSGSDAAKYEEEESGGYDGEGRSLYWRSRGSRRRRRNYISYGALSANRVLCPPRSGRSYYTHNCHTANHPANPYKRGCSCITHCRR